MYAVDYGDLRIGARGVRDDSEQRRGLSELHREAVRGRVPQGLRIEGLTAPTHHLLAEA